MYFFFFFDKHVKICITIFKFFTEITEGKQVAEELQSTTQQPSVKHDYNTQSQEPDRNAEGLHKTTKSVPHALRKTVLRRQFEHHESRAGSYWPPQARLQKIHLPQKTDDGHQAPTYREAESCSRRQ